MPSRSASVLLLLLADDLAKDPGETTDLAAAQLDHARGLTALLAREHVPSAEFPLVVIDPKQR